MSYCHFTAMEYCSADNGNGGIEHWWECLVCGHTKPHSVSIRGSEI